MPGGSDAGCVAGAAAVVGDRARGRAVRGRALRPGQPAPRGVRGVAGGHRCADGALARRTVAGRVPGRPDRRRAAGGPARPGRLGARLWAAVRRTEPGGAGAGAAGGRRGARLRVALGRRLHLRPRARGLPGRLAGQLGRHGHVLRGGRRGHARPARAHRRRAVNRPTGADRQPGADRRIAVRTASGLGDYYTIHNGLLLRDPYMYLMIGSAMATAFVGLLVLRRARGTWLGGRLTLPRNRVQRRHFYGGAVFGVGFGLGATCPGMTVAMVATGGLYGLVVLVGLLFGLWLRGRVEQRSAPATPEPTRRRLADTAARDA